MKESADLHDNNRDKEVDATRGWQARSNSKDKLQFLLTAFEDIRLDTERRGYLVKGLIATTGLAVIWGPPKCGKSFWRQTLACT
jgi:hypothetical protein